MSFTAKGGKKKKSRQTPHTVLQKLSPKLTLTPLRFSLVSLQITPSTGLTKVSIKGFSDIRSNIWGHNIREWHHQPMIQAYFFDQTP